MSDCIHCDIHDLLEPELAREGADLGQIAAKVTEVLADLVLIAAPEDRAALLADIIANLGHMVLGEIRAPERAAEPAARRSRRTALRYGETLVHAASCRARRARIFSNSMKAENAIAA